MADFNNAVMTNAGAALLAESLAGRSKIKFTKLATGSGTYTEQEKTRTSLQARTALKIKQQEIPFSKIEMATETCVKLVALVSNETISAGYYVNEVGIYAVDELHPGASPVLYSIAVANIADYLPPYNNLTPSTITQEYFATVDNALTVTIQTKTGAVALAEDLEATNEELERTMQENDRIYPGRDLTVVHAEEIKKHANEWAWIKDRIKKNNFKGIHVADYIPITMNGQNLNMQVAGIDTYRNATTQNPGHHIDFISDNCLSQLTRWNNSESNNGNSSQNSPYASSSLYNFLNTTIFNHLPDKIKTIISNKTILMESRFSSSGQLSESNSWNWVQLGKLWIPIEFEVTGTVIWGTRIWSQGQAVQYPIFASSCNFRLKKSGESGGYCDWWLATTTSGSQTDCIHISHAGNLNGHSSANSEKFIPICFRISEN